MANKIKVNIGQLYAVTQGTYKGSNLVIINKTNESYECLDLPDMINRQIPTIDIEAGIDNNIIELLETLPSDIINICSKQYEKNTNN